MRDMHHSLIRLAVAALFVLLATEIGQAKRFDYLVGPSGTSDQQTPPPSPAPNGTAPASAAPAGQESDEAAGSETQSDAAVEVDGEETPSGLFGPFLHGRNGIIAQYLYTGDTFTNLRGGKNTNSATRYLGVVDVAITADLNQLGLRPGGTFFIYGQDIHGRSSTEDDVGDYQCLSNIDAPRRTQVSEYWWQQSFLDGEVTLRLGKQDANAEFAVVDLAGDFINSSFGLAPTVPMPTYPDPSAGLAVFYTPNDWLALKSGIWDGAPDGRNWGFSGTGTAFSVAEAELMWSLLEERLPGGFHIGAWYHSDDPDEVAADGKFDGNYGVYLGGEQMVLKESWEPADDQGLGVFGQFGWAPDDRNEASRYFGAGLVYKGLVSGRDDDITGIGVAALWFSDRLDLDSETAVELFHRVQLGEYISLKPDLQYIARPSGVERDALVAGMRFEIAL